MRVLLRGTAIRMQDACAAAGTGTLVAGMVCLEHQLKRAERAEPSDAARLRSPAHFGNKDWSHWERT